MEQNKYLIIFELLIGGGLLFRIGKFFRDKIINRKPLLIRIYDEDLSFKRHVESGIKSSGNPTIFSIPINFINRSNLNVNVDYYYPEIQFKEEIEGLEFKIDSSGGTKFPLKPSKDSEQKELLLLMAPYKDHSWEEVVNLLKPEEEKNNYIIIRINYRVSTNPKKHEKKIVIKDFFKEIINEIVKNKLVKS